MKREKDLIFFFLPKEISIFKWLFVSKINEFVKILFSKHPETIH